MMDSILKLHADSYEHIKVDGHDLITDYHIV